MREMECQQSIVEVIVITKQLSTIVLDHFDDGLNTRFDFFLYSLLFSHPRVRAVDGKSWA